jgi:hypothetical protein
VSAQQLNYGTQVRDPSGHIGYVLGYQPAPKGALHEVDVRVFWFDSYGDDAELLGAAHAWEPTGRHADDLVLAHMKSLEADRELLEAMGRYEVCQKCGGRVGAVDDFHRCLCDSSSSEH